MITLPLHTKSTLNLREHWSARAARAKRQRSVARMMCRAQAVAVGLPAVVTMTRIAPSRGLDDDNLAGALKSVRDGIADAFGVDDRDPRIVWRCAQGRGKQYWVEVEIAGAQGDE